MPEIVRVVSDGEELVLSEGEAFRIHPAPLPVTPRSRDVASAPARVAVRYLGFHDVRDRREFTLDAQRGDEVRRYAVCIELAAFSTRKALLQDGPDICYQKLLREIVDSGLPGPDDIDVTEDDLAAYRTAHPARVRKGFSSSPPPARPPAVDGAAPVDGGAVGERGSS